MDAPCALTLFAGGCSSCADGIGALSEGNALELGDIAGCCATGESGGGVTSLWGGCVLAAVGNVDESGRTVSRATATGAKGGLS